MSSIFRQSEGLEKMVAKKRGRQATEFQGCDESIDEDGIWRQNFLPNYDFYDRLEFMAKGR